LRQNQKTRGQSCLRSFIEFARPTPEGRKFLVVAPGFLGKIAPSNGRDWFGAMFKLTKQQQLFLCVVLLLLLTGWAVKAWRTAHPPSPAAAATIR